MRNSGASHNIRVFRFHEIDSRTTASWASLEDRALESNAYLSPHFVIPAMRRLSTPKEMRESVFVFVERAAVGAKEIIGAGVFSRSPGTRALPVPHLRAYRSPHSYLSGVLLDRDDAEGAVRAFFRFFQSGGAAGHGVDFEDRLSEGVQAELIAAVAAESGATWHERAAKRRAFFVPSEGGEQYLKTAFSSHRGKKLRQASRRLEELGDVAWRAMFGADVDEGAVERFLEIEHRGWKGEEGTSLRSQHSHEAFFREMVDGFLSRERMFFTELTLDGALIASTVNLVSGGAGFAFKIGWHPDYAKLSPGVLNEVEFIRHAPELCAGLSLIDSGAAEGSFIEQLWSGRRVLTSGAFGTKFIGSSVLSGVDRLRSLKRRCRPLAKER